MRRYPRAENRVWSDQEDHEEKGLNDRAASTWGLHSDSFNDTSSRRRSNCFTNNFQTPYRSKSQIQAPFPCTPFNTGTSATASTVVPARSMWNVTDWQKVVFSDESQFVLGTEDKRVRVWRRPGERYNSPTLIYVTLPAQLV
ncbi:uncharacterized protein TNCV_2759801 [Trichonephila clavipes]|nr:uncharacterized protein TNCV_2759801 [Trichonephila clavipes]